tara:strand:+ start:770 stop:2200 length:1431 start_codon:yes stop_codon:yes gene_type:complete
MPRFPAPEVQYKRDETARAKHITRARRDFRTLLRALKADATAIKSRNKRDVKKQKREMVKAIKDRGDVNGFLDKFVGTEDVHKNAYSWRNKGRYLLRDVSLGVTPLKNAYADLDKITGNGFQWLTVSEFQAPLRETIPASIRAYLPDTVEVNVDKNGTIQRVTDRFNNERLTLAVKIDHQKKLLKKYNTIAKRVKRDLRSSDEVTRLSALITAIMMETGIRPGIAGNGVIKGKGDDAEFIETFGAITLGPSHVRFVRNNFAELSFLGKKGGVNTASLSDKVIITALRDYVSNAVKKGSKYVFVTADGYQYTYADLNRYFREHFKGLTPTDFRKLKASETVFDALREEQAGLYDRIRAFVGMEQDVLQERVAEEIAITLERAVVRAQEALSHDSATTTRTQYINPEVLFRFLSAGGLSGSFRKAILSGKPTLAFDPQRFVEIAVASNVRMAFLRRAAEMLTLGDLLNVLEDPESDLS